MTTKYKCESYKSHDIISEDATWEICQAPKNIRSVIDIFSNIHLKTLSSMDIKYTELLCGFDKNSNHLVSFTNQYIDCTQPTSVWFNYPFDASLKATIYPGVRMSKDKRGIIVDHIGYFMWQIAQVFADIYKDKWKDVGIGEHTFEDLYLEGISICANNQMKLYIGSKNIN